jgi:hypothetical protein
VFVGRCLDSGFWVLRSGFCAAVLPSPPATRTDIMETIHAALLEAGSRIAPLASLDEIAGFFQAAAAIGPTAPARATAVAQRLGGSLVDAASMLASILPTLPSMPNVERLLSVLPPCQDMQLGPTRDTCAVCDNGVLEPSQCFTTAPLISAKGLVKQVQLFKRRCSCCHADHYLSYAAGGLRLQRGEQVPYEGCTDARYFHITTSCVWEASLLVDFEAQALNSHTGFSTFMAEYRMKYGGELPFSDDRAHRAFAHAFYAWSLLRWRLDLGLPSGVVVKLSRAPTRLARFGSRRFYSVPVALVRVDGCRESLASCVQVCEYSYHSCRYKIVTRRNI